MEALILAGGKAERLGDAAQGLPKPLVHVCGRALATYQVARLADAGVSRVIIACSQGTEALFQQELGGLGPEIVAVGEREPLGRGGGLRFAASQRHDSGPVYALNGDELLAVDFRDLLERHKERAPAATLVVSQVRSPFGVVDVRDDDTIAGFREAQCFRNGSAQASMCSTTNVSCACRSVAITRRRRSPSLPERASCSRTATRASG